MDLSQISLETQLIFRLIPDLILSLCIFIFQISSLISISHLSLTIAFRCFEFIHQKVQGQHEICRRQTQALPCIRGLFKLPAISLMTQAAKASLGRQRQHDKNNDKMTRLLIFMCVCVNDATLTVEAAGDSLFLCAINKG